MVESTALEMRRTGNRTVGSNPTLSARQSSLDVVSDAWWAVGVPLHEADEGGASAGPMTTTVISRSPAFANLRFSGMV